MLMPSFASKWQPVFVNGQVVYFRYFSYIDTDRIIVITKLIVGMDQHIFKIAGKPLPATNLHANVCSNFLAIAAKCNIGMIIGISQNGCEANI